ncbi:MAG: MoxR family ATPase [Clostridiales bacterium]|nr:MoxR family ATPase [Clostridiales bacterium]
MEYSVMASNILNEIKKVVIGKDEIIEKVLVALLAKGHILIEDIPGVGKTTLALAFSKAMSLKCNRLQCTPDVLPTDITGFSMYNKELGSFEYKEGAAMCNLLLADEVNRTSSKTQSALLEVMEEGKITVDGVTREAPKPFMVIATQNPLGSVGTQMLPESQLDRFMIKITMGYPDIKSEIDILKGKQKRNPLEEVNQVVSAEDIIKMQNHVEGIFIHEKIYEYIAKLVVATRTNSLIALGVSPRGTIALTQMAKARAFICNRDYVTPEDVLDVFIDVVSHRILLNSKAKLNNITIPKLLKDIENSITIKEIING